MSFPFEQAVCFTPGRGGYKPTGFVIHRMAGTFEGTRSWFKNRNSGASSTYIVSYQGDILQMVKSEDMSWASGIGWHNNKPMVLGTAGQIIYLDTSKMAKYVLDRVNQNPNSSTISIEIEGYPQEGMTDAAYEALAKIIKYESALWGIPINRYHIIRHSEINPYNRPNCPGLTVDLDRIVRDATGETTPPIIEAPKEIPEHYRVTKGGWRSNIVAEIVNAGFWSGGIEDNLPKFNYLNPITPTNGWKPGDLVRIKENTIDPVKEPTIPDPIFIGGGPMLPVLEDPKMIEELKTQVEAQGAQIINLTQLKEASDRSITELTGQNQRLSTEFQNALARIDQQDITIKDLTTKLDKALALNTEKDKRIYELEITISAFNQSPNKQLEREIIKNTPAAAFPSKFMANWKQFMYTGKARFLRIFTTYASSPIFGLIMINIVSMIPQWTNELYNSALPVIPASFVHYFTALYGMYKIFETGKIAWLKKKALENSEHIYQTLAPSYVSGTMAAGLEGPVNK